MRGAGPFHRSTVARHLTSTSVRLTRSSMAPLGSRMHSGPHSHQELEEGSTLVSGSTIQSRQCSQGQQSSAAQHRRCRAALPKTV